MSPESFSFNGEVVAKHLLPYVQSGQTIGVGTGRTVTSVLKALIPLMKQHKFSISVLTTSYESALQCRELGLNCFSPAAAPVELDWGFDGADEIDGAGRIIKGQGGAMLQEKIIARRCKKWIVVADESKTVTRLGEKKPIPIEVIPSAINSAQTDVLKLGAKAISLRNSGGGKHGPVITEAGNLILDAMFDNISDTLENELKQVVGVVETGLFTRFASEILIVSDQNIKIMVPPRNV